MYRSKRPLIFLLPIICAVVLNGALTTPSSAATPDCVYKSSDPDGDGWGWENHRSCKVSDSSVKRPDDDGRKKKDTGGPKKDGTLYKGRHPYCSSPDADIDGDGWGYENHRSCFVGTAKKDPGLIFRQQFNLSSPGLYQGDQLNSGWDTPRWHIGFDEGRVSIVTDDAAHGNAMEVTYPAGAYGSDGASAFLADVQFSMGLPKSYDELYLSYDIKFGKDFQFVLGGKLPGLCGADTNQAPETGCNTGGGFPSGYDGWSARTMWRADGAMENYVYHAGQKNYYGDDEHWNVHATPERWHRIQQRVVLNSVGRKNGILEAWFDGKKVLSIDNFEYRKIESVGINLFYFSTFFGGNDPTWAPTADQTIRFDNFAISTKPITD
ncbi:hypothetical protein AB833_05865 [Chromatiales bacterium (ex Bugula neritina AB1)]|nr:hypothetical protein AB833_05865 [Chromatiales bacterium (ex Bugula neritina AB1)]